MANYSFIRKIEKWIFKFKSSQVFMLMVIPLFIVVLITIMSNISHTVKRLSQNHIIRTIEKLEVELEKVVSPAVADLKMAREVSIAAGFDMSDINRFNIIMRPIMASNRVINSGVFSNSLGEELMLFSRDDSVWVNRVTHNPINGVKTVTFKQYYLDKKLHLKSEKSWVDSSAMNNDPRNKLWYQKAMLTPPNAYIWTKPYKLLTTGEPGISISTHWQSAKDTSVQNVLSFDILMMDIIEYMNKLKISEHASSVLFSDSDNIICQSNHTKFSDIDSVKKYSFSTCNSIGMPVFSTMLKHIGHENIGQGVPFSFEFEGEAWWGEVVTYNRFGLSKMRIAVLVPESDFMSEINQSRLVVILGFMLVFILTIGTLGVYRKQQKRNKLLSYNNEEIAHQKEKIEKQHTLVRKQHNKIQDIFGELTNSISYAQRIQSSVLSNQSILSKNVRDSFVLYKPRDVVSGDFYFLYKANNKLIIIVSDCTGHGIPGAFMSMLGISILNSIILSNCKLEPDIILNRLRKYIIHSLGQSQKGNGQRDGMDMSICVLDLDTNKMKFAGANNSIIILSKNHLDWAERKEVKHMVSSDSSTNLFKVKADNMPISIYLKMNDFSSHEFQLEKGDQVYLYSDGFVDQFGGKNESIRNSGGKKFKIRAFQRLLLENAHLSAKEQRTQLEKTLVEWQGSLEQVDDITVLGFHV